MIKIILCFWTLVFLTVAETSLYLEHSESGHKNSDVDRTRKVGEHNQRSEQHNPTDAELIDRLEQSLLSSFGLDERPKVDKNQVKIPPYMFHLYNLKVKQNLEEKEEVEESRKQSKASAKFSSQILSNTVRSFTHSESPEDKFHPSHKMLFQFNTTSIPDREILQGAKLRIIHLSHPLSFNNTSNEVHKAKRRWSKHELVYLNRINVFDVVRPNRGSRDPIHRLIDTRVVDSRINDTASFDVSPAIKRWLSKPHTNYGLYVEVVPLKTNLTWLKEANHVRLRRNVEENSDEWNAQQPLLIVHTDDQHLKSREKRNAPVPAYKRPHCRRYNLHVDFRKVDWDTWIVAPPGYDAYFCQGECPYPLAKHMNATNHAVIQNIIHSRYPSRVPSACCVPVKHSAISMLYLDRDRKVVLKTYQDMIVEACGCQ